MMLLCRINLTGRSVCEKEQEAHVFKTFYDDTSFPSSFKFYQTREILTHNCTEGQSGTFIILSAELLDNFFSNFTVTLISINLQNDFLKNN